MVSLVHIEPRTFYTPAEAAAFLDVKEATIKGYCRAGKASGVKIETKKIGPRHEWRIKGVSILAIRVAWGLDT
jgi:hypothetical protein